MMPLFMVIFAGFIGALVAPTLAVRLRGAIGWVLALLPAALAVYFLSLMPQAAAGTPLAASYPWVLDLGLALSLRADGLNLLFALLVSGVGTLVVCYAGDYLKSHPHLGRFYAWLLTFMAALFCGGMLFVFVAGSVGVRPFWGTLGQTPHPPHEAPFSLWLSPAVLSGLSILAGLYPEFLSHNLFSPAASAVIGQSSVIDLALWHDITTSLVLSGLTLIVGVCLHLQRDRVRHYANRIIVDRRPTRFYSTALNALNGAARWQTETLQGGYLRLLSSHIISQIGYVLMGLGLFSPQALAGAVFFIFHVSVAKATLFLVSGVAERLGGTLGLQPRGAHLQRCEPGTFASRPTSIAWLLRIHTIEGVGRR